MQIRDRYLQFRSIVGMNVLVNIAGKPISIVISVLLVPLYIKFLGPESYGIIGLYTSTCMMFSLLDCGMGLTLNRSLAQLAPSADAKDLARSLEILYWVIGLAAGLALFALAPFIAHKWVKPEQLSAETIERVLRIGALVFVFQWPISLYSNGLNGLQRQVRLMAIGTVTGVLRGLITVGVLWHVSPSLDAFFFCQLAVTVAQVLWLRASLWAGITETADPPHFDFKRLKAVWRFASSTFVLSLLSMVLSQLDKFLLSRLIDLKSFGYYVLASTAATSALSLGNSVYTAVFPRLCQLSEPDNRKKLSLLYHKSCQLTATLVLPVAMLLCFFGRELLTLWTRNPELAKNAGPLLSLISVGMAINTVMGLPLGLQLAHGWVRLSIYKNLVAIAVFVPLMIGLARSFGVMGAAATWCGLNISYFLFEIPIMHRRILKGEAVDWYIHDFGYPLVASVLVMTVAWLLIPSQSSQLMWAGSLAFSLVAGVAVALMATTQTRQIIIHHWVALASRKLWSRIP